MMTQVLTTVGGVLGAQALALAALAMRLRWQAVHDKQLRDTFSMMAERLPEVSVIEIHDAGTQLRVHIAAGSPRESNV
jgi:hypothetical protein